MQSPHAPQQLKLDSPCFRCCCTRCPVAVAPALTQARGLGRAGPRGTGRCCVTTSRESPSPPSAAWRAGVLWRMLCIHACMHACKPPACNASMHILMHACMRIGLRGAVSPCPHPCSMLPACVRLSHVLHARTRHGRMQPLLSARIVYNKSTHPNKATHASRLMWHALRAHQLVQRTRPASSTLASHQFQGGTLPSHTRRRAAPRALHRSLPASSVP